MGIPSLLEKLFGSFSICFFNFLFSIFSIFILVSFCLVLVDGASFVSKRVGYSKKKKKKGKERKKKKRKFQNNKQEIRISENRTNLQKKKKTIKIQKQKKGEKN